MIDTILNVVYDTETANAFGTRQSDCAASDPQWYQETLYRHPQGYWFLAGEGGSRSHYAVEDSQGNRSGSSGIIPIGRSRAMRWLAETGNEAVLREYFGNEKEYIAKEYNISW